MRRVFSLTGVVPLGAFLLGHVLVNFLALRDRAAFASIHAALDHTIWLPAFEALFVFLPLAAHAGLGVLLFASRTAASRPTPYPPAVHRAMRVTSIAILAFLVVHLVELRFRSPGGVDEGVTATWLAADLSATSHGIPLWGLAYLVGAGCVCFHFAAGIWGYFAANGSASPGGGLGRNARWNAGWVAGLAGAVLFLVLADIVVFHATGARLFGGLGEAVSADSACPP